MGHMEPQNFIARVIEQLQGGWIGIGNHPVLAGGDHSLGHAARQGPAHGLAVTQLIFGASARRMMMVDRPQRADDQHQG